MAPSDDWSSPPRGELSITPLDTRASLGTLEPSPSTLGPSLGTALEPGLDPSEVDEWSLPPSGWTQGVTNGCGEEGEEGGEGGGGSTTEEWRRVLGAILGTLDTTLQALQGSSIQVLLFRTHLN